MESVARALGEATTSVSAGRLIKILLSLDAAEKYQKWSLFYVESLAEQYRLRKLVDGHVVLVSAKTSEEVSAPTQMLASNKLHARYRRDDGSESVYSPPQALIALLLTEHIVRGLGEHWSNTRQRLYNRRKLRTPSQFDLLRAIVDVSLDDSSVRFTPHAIANTLLGPRLPRHPDRARVYSGVEFHFRALAASKAIDRETAEGGESLGFKIGETAIAELDRQSIARQAESRENTNRYLIVTLTIASLFAAGMQAWIAQGAREVASDALELQRAQLNLELQRDQRALKEKAEQQATEAKSNVPQSHRPQRTDRRRGEKDGKGSGGQ